MSPTLIYFEYLDFIPTVSAASSSTPCVMIQFSFLRSGLVFSADRWVLICFIQSPKSLFHLFRFQRTSINQHVTHDEDNRRKYKDRRRETFEKHTRGEEDDRRSQLICLWNQRRRRERDYQHRRGGGGGSNYPETIVKQCDRKRALCGNNSQTDRQTERQREREIEREREHFVLMTVKAADWQMREEEKSFRLVFISHIRLLRDDRSSSAGCDPNILTTSTTREEEKTKHLTFSPSSHPSKIQITARGFLNRGVQTSAHCSFSEWR